MGAILYSGIYFATDVLNEKYGRKEANRAVLLGFVANLAVIVTLLISIQFRPSDITGSALEVHNAISTLAGYSPKFVIGSLAAYLISQTFDGLNCMLIKRVTITAKFATKPNKTALFASFLPYFSFNTSVAK